MTMARSRSMRAHNRLEQTKSSNWLPAPDGPFSLYVRAYWGTEAILDGSWMPPVVEKVRQLGNAFCQHGGFGECLLMALSGRRARRLSCQLLTHKREITPSRSCNHTCLLKMLGQRWLERRASHSRFWKRRQTPPRRYEIDSPSDT